MAAKAVGVCALCGTTVTQDKRAGSDEDGHVFCTDKHRPIKWVRVNNDWQLNTQS